MADSSPVNCVYGLFVANVSVRTRICRSEGHTQGPGHACYGRTLIQQTRIGHPAPGAFPRHKPECLGAGVASVSLREFPPITPLFGGNQPRSAQPAFGFPSVEPHFLGWFDFLQSARNHGRVAQAVRSGPNVSGPRSGQKCSTLPRTERERIVEAAKTTCFPRSLTAGLVGDKVGTMADILIECDPQSDKAGVL